MPVRTTVAATTFIGGEPMNSATKRLAGVSYSSSGRAELLQHALAQHRDPVAHRHGLDLVVGDVERRRPGTRAAARGSRRASDRAAWRRGWTAARPSGRPRRCGRWRGPSPPAAAGRRRAPSACGAGSSVEARGSRRPPRPRVASALPAPGAAERERDVSPHGHVRVERVVLEDHRDVALRRVHVVDHPVADQQPTVGDLLQAGRHAQRSRLAAAGRADEDEELAVADVEVEFGDRLGAVRVPLGDAGRR